jgi:succinate dehydrogenase / fumarate reductase cytochrome b subunit
VVWLLLALAHGPDSYATARAVCGSWVGLIVLFGWSWALFFHLCNGIRHLVWDVGKGFAIAQAYRSGVIVVIVSLVFTALVWACVFAQGGAA